MAELSEEQKLDVVRLIAQFRSYAEVVVYLNEQHEAATTIQQIRHYDPENILYRAGDKWRPMFDAFRKAYLEEIVQVPAANQGYRLRVLQEGIETARRAGKWAMVSTLIEQASKEIGGVFTNQREVSLKDGRARARDLSSDERKEALFAIIDEALAKRPTDQGTGSVQ